MTILDSIKAAEERAKLLKYSAGIFAKDYLHEAESQASKDADDLVTKARTVAREKVAEAEKQSVIRLRELLSERESQNNLFAEKSANHIEEAVDFIIGKVVN